MLFRSDGGKSLADESQVEMSEFAEAQGYRSIDERAQLDRWVISELNRCAQDVVTAMDNYDNYVACQRLNEFVDGLSNWYVRRSRDRFWSEDKTSQDKYDAYWTLYECLVTSCKLIAPFTPFLAEAMWQNLTTVFDGKALESVHLCDYPTGNQDQVDEQLSKQMEVLREIASLGRSARMESRLKVRQPLAGVEVILNQADHQGWLDENADILKDELNVKKIDFSQEADQYISYRVQPNFKRLGQRVRHLMPKVKSALGSADGGELLSQLNQDGKIVLTFDDEQVELDNEDIQVQLQAKEGWAAAQGKSSVVVLSTELSDELLREGYARDMVRFVQDLRKEAGLKFNDKIKLGVEVDDQIKKAIEENQEFILSEVQAVEFGFAKIDDGASVTKTIGESEIVLSLVKAS